MGRSDVCLHLPLINVLLSRHVHLAGHFDKPTSDTATLTDGSRATRFGIFSSLAPWASQFVSRYVTQMLITRSMYPLCSRRNMCAAPRRPEDVVNIPYLLKYEA